jgi:TRAP-type mannitol/chloroaromatic compound transport system permease small subunit
VDALLEKIAAAIDRLNETVGRSVSWLTLAMVLVTFAIVVLRYGFSLGSIALQESVTYMHALVFMLAAAYTFRHDEHVRVDVFYQRLSARARAWVDLVGTLLLLLPVMAFIFWSSLNYVLNAWGLREGSPEAGGLPLVYLLKSVLVVMPVLFALQGLATICRSLLALRRKGSAGEAD